MTCCGHCRDANDFFSERTARGDLKKYIRRGPDKQTSLLVESIRKTGINGETLLDVGGGIGAIQLELFKYGISKSVNVDASTAYQAVSKEEVSKRGLDAKTEYYFGDFTSMASSLPEADIVTLDKVICCYPDMKNLLQLSLGKSGKIYGLVYPRVNRFTKLGFWLINFWFRIRRSEFRTYLHSPSLVNEIISNQGFRNISNQKTLLWQVAVYKRGGGNRKTDEQNNR
jgi:hypothetical protein